jgi:flagellar biosynthetic protein FliR
MTIEIPIAEPVLVSLVFVRVTSLMLMAPVFAHGAVSMRIRASLALGLALLVAPGAVDAARLPDSLAMAVVSELFVGLAIGFVSALVLAPVTFMSEIVSVQGGLGAASALDPSSEAPSVVIAALMRFAALILFLAIGGHHEVIRALWLSFEAIPVGSWLSLSSIASIASLGSVVFETGLRLAAPLTILLLASNLVVGALGRTIPQLNLISIQLPAQIALTLAVLALGAGVFIDSVAGEVAYVLDRGLGAVFEGL